MSVHCIYVYVHVYTMLGWKQWFWRGFNANFNSQYCSDAYSNDSTKVYRLEAVKIVTNIGICTDMYIPCIYIYICKFPFMYMTRTGIYINVQTCMYICLFVHTWYIHVHTMYVHVWHFLTCMYMLNTCLYRFSKSCPGASIWILADLRCRRSNLRCRIIPTLPTIWPTTS